MSKNIVISFAKGSDRYLNGLENIKLKQRIRTSLWDIQTYSHESQIDDSCPVHSDNPYAFKAYAIMKAYNEGYDNILWIDSVVDIVQPLDKLFKHIETNGSAFFNNIGYRVKDFCNNSCIDIMDANLSELHAPMIMACAMGLNRNLAKDFIQEYYDYCNKGAFKGSWDNHRHDQTVASILIERYTYPILTGFETFFMYEEHINKTVKVDGVPLTMTKGDDVCLISK